MTDIDADSEESAENTTHGCTIHVLPPEAKLGETVPKDALERCGDAADGKYAVRDADGFESEEWLCPRHKESFVEVEEVEA